MASDPRDMAAQAILQRYDQTSIQQMARLWGIKSKTAHKAALLPPLTKLLFSPQRVRSALESLEPGERAVLDQLILLGGLTSTWVLRLLLEGAGIIDPAARTQYGQIELSRGSVSAQGSRRFEDLVARLGVQGLAFTAVTPGYQPVLKLGVPATSIFIPRPILRELPSVGIAVETTSPPTYERASDLSALFRDLYVLVSAARDEPLGVIASGDLSKKAMVRLDRQFRISENAGSVKSESELGRLPLLRVIAQELNLLVWREGALYPGDAAEGFLALPRGQRLKMIFTAYQGTTAFSELTRLGIPVWPKTQIRNPRVALARQRVLREVAALPAGEWIPIAHLVDRIRKGAFEFFLPRDRAVSQWYEAAYVYEPYPYAGDNDMLLHLGRTQNEEYELPSRSVEWDEVEGALVREIVVEPLWWLGIVDLGMADPDAAPRAFRITPEGAMVLQGRAPSIPAGEPQVIVQPNFQIFALEPTGEDVLYQLDRIARRVRSEQVVEYQLSRESVYAAQQRGIEADEIVALLDRLSSVPLPQNVRRSIEDWGAEHSRIVMHRHVGLIHTADPEILDTLYAEHLLLGLLGRRVAPTVALVPQAHLGRIQEVMIEGGMAHRLPLPVLNRGSSVGTPPLLDVDAAGVITFRERVPSIFLHEAIGPFTELVPTGGARLTQAGLRRGARRGVAADAVIERLQSLSGRPIPDEVRAMVQQWARDWGRGALGTVSLLQMETVEAASQIASDEELSRYFKPFPGAPTVLLVTGDKKKATALLKERGVELGATVPLKA